VARIVVETDVRVPMRDGVELVADVYRPEVAGTVPVLVHRTPYDRQIAAFSNIPADFLRLVREGFAVVLQDTRGRAGSDGRFRPFADEADDGADTLAWAQSRPWSSGRVGMFGASYVGATQWLAAAAGGDAVGAITPVVSSADYHSWLYRGGAFELGFALLWTAMFLAPPEAIRAGGDVGAVLDAADGADRLYLRTPLTDVPELTGAAPWYADWLARPAYDDGWAAVRRSSASSASLPPRSSSPGGTTCSARARWRATSRCGGTAAASRREPARGSSSGRGRTACWAGRSSSARSASGPPRTEST